MLAKRVIPCLDVDRGRVVKGTNFLNLRDAGDPVAVAARYEQDGADELVFLDITASHEGRDIMLDVVRRTAEQVFMPLTVGGGIRTLEDIRALLLAGCDKVSINSAAVRDPEFVRAAALRFGSQCIVVNIDPKRVAARRPRGVGSPHQRRPHRHGAGGGRLGPAGRGAGRRRDRADQHGRRRHQGRLRFGDDRRGERGGVDPRRRQRRGRAARAPGRRGDASARPTRRWRPAFSTSASTRSRKPNASWPSGASPSAWRRKRQHASAAAPAADWSLKRPVQQVSRRGIDMLMPKFRQRSGLRQFRRPAPGTGNRQAVPRLREARRRATCT